jgi:hypothetical protein
MQQNDHLPVGRPGIDYVERELAAMEILHRSTVSARRSGSPSRLYTLIRDD